MHVEDDRVVRVEGARDHPFTRGARCAKVNDYPSRTYAADRLLHPLRRTGSKGEGRFERISWDEALATIAARGLADGERVALRNARAELHAWLRVTEDVRPGVVSPPGKWWGQPAETGAVANLLTASAWSPGGQPAYNDTFVSVTAAPAPA